MGDIGAETARTSAHLLSWGALSAAEVRALLDRGAYLLDVRPVRRYLDAHVRGTLHDELRPEFAEWLPRLLPPEAAGRVTLVAAGAQAVAAAATLLEEAGYGAPLGWLPDEPAAWARGGLPVARAVGVAVDELRRCLAAREPLVVVDVRRAEEWAAGHLPGALHLELAGLAAGEQPVSLSAEASVVAYCGGSRRASTALSLLERRGYTHLHLLEGGWEAWEGASP